jgi:hypothetical protein
MADLVRGQIAYPEKRMPANLLWGDASDVAVYIAKCSAVPHCGVTASSRAACDDHRRRHATSAPPTARVASSSPTARAVTLKAAGTTGTIGPNLDALKPSESRVALQVTNGGAGCRPSRAS